MFDRADRFHENEIMSRLEKINNLKMEDFGNDSGRSERWSKEIDRLFAEIDEAKRQYNEMMEIAGDWEDKEYAARLMPVIEFLSKDSDNPLIVKNNLKHNFKMYTEFMGVPNLGNYI